jgi:uncharacterized protein (UPF0332 family)
MTPKPTTRDVQKSLYVNFLKKAEECFHVAKSSFTAEEWNASAINAIHSSISACDAMCVYFLGKRHAGENHDEVVSLFMTIKGGNEEIKANANRILRILRIKNMAEYEERLVYRPEAEKVLKDCERFFEFVRKELP